MDTRKMFLKLVLYEGIGLQFLKPHREDLIPRRSQC